MNPGNRRDSLFLCRWPVHEIEFLGGTGEGGIEPVDIVGCEHIIRHIPLIEIHMCPLSALGLMTGHGIGELHLKGIVITVALQFFDAFRLLSGSTTPYQKYDIFRKYITRTPLRFLYYPHGLDGKVYRKKVRVSRLSKTEMTKYGVLDCDISFTPYTPWYEIQTFENVPDAVDDSAHWIWDVGNSWRDSDDVDPETPRYIFGGEARNIIDFDCDSTEKGFIKLTIKGPALNPTWTQYVNGGLKSTGGFATSSNFSLTADEWLTIDNTEGQFSMTVYNRVTGDTRNVYSLRDFDKLCFFNLEEGRNAFAVASQDGIPLSIVVEGHIHYATV